MREPSSVHALCRALFAAMLVEPGQSLGDAEQRCIRGASEACWQAALDALALHKVHPLLQHQLLSLDLSAHLPAAILAQLGTARSETQARNLMLLLAAGEVVRAMPEGSSVLALKGMVLADGYYPHFATRPMGDVDLVAAPGEHRLLCDAAERAGFRLSPEHAFQAECVTYVNELGLLCDLHQHVDAFVDEPWGQLVEPLALRTLRGLKVLKLEPSAMLAHVVTHMVHHLPEVGPVLLWLVDAALLLRAHDTGLDLARVRRLCEAEPAAYAFLLRLVRLLQQRGARVPSDFARAARRVPPLSLAEVLRQRRLTPWALPRPKGWLRLALSRAGVRDYSHFPILRAADLCVWPWDVWQAHRGRERALGGHQP